jgi:CRP-like cAMP-binding protein
MTGLAEIAAVAFVGLVTTSSAMLGALLGLWVRIPKSVLAVLLAFAAGSLICALAIELAFESVHALQHQHFGPQQAWQFVGGGFALGAAIYYCGAMFLEQRGAAVRLPTRFREFAINQKRKSSQELIGLLCKSDLMRHLPPDRIEAILPCIEARHLDAGEVLFRTGDKGDALYIVRHGSVAVLPECAGDGSSPEKPIAQLSEGQTVGEMALLTGNPRSATIRATVPTELLRIGKDDFERLIHEDRELEAAVRRLSHERAISNLSSGGLNPSTWAAIAASNVHHLTRRESDKMLMQAGHGAGLAIVLGNVLDTIPGCLVIGAKFDGMQTLSLSLILGMFIGGIPEAAASAAILRRAGYAAGTVLLLWSIVVVAGVVSAVAGHSLIGNSPSLVSTFFQAVAGGAVLALVAHAMIPEAIHQGGSVIVLPTVAGFLFALYFAVQPPA